ncbi:GntR family transcriptional regulator [Pseudaminobacter arsenicus]|uniref:GntR family transcriptional regulator n=1 Tax=Borborobacter arsenicus TaxID=1851146 RepID=A0A432V1N0_9HYPH|nr:GntR family transcriptional regulator [Pseudaminobacter arsenicus]RUM96015.1 GntR family transcriptional regulator [Pseudaminobacter arsenicus]
MSDDISISEKAYQYLRSMIIDGKIDTNKAFTERALAEKLQSSRTPLRAAINRLEGEGLIERLAGGGIVVREIKIEELVEILMVRLLLEGEAAALCAARAPAEATAALIAQSEYFLTNSDAEFDAFWAYDDRFHHYVAEHSGKPLLAKLIGNLRDMARMCHVTRMEHSFVSQAEEHIAVLRQIEAGSPELARQAMVDHITKVRERLMRWLFDS